MSSDSEFEAFLRRFEPRAPSPLPKRRRPPIGAWWALAAAALVVAAVWMGRRPVEVPGREAPRLVRESRPRPTMGELSVLLRHTDDGKLAEEMANRVLPDPRRPGGALRELAGPDPGL